MAPGDGVREAEEEFKAQRDYCATMFREARSLGKNEEAREWLDGFYQVEFARCKFYKETAEGIGKLIEKYPACAPLIILSQESLMEKHDRLAELLNKFALDTALAE